jgi:hypothetical protein
MPRYKVIELIVPEHDIMEQQHWYWDKRLTKKAAMEWFHEQCEDFNIEPPQKYLLRVLTFNQSGSYCRNLTKVFVDTTN